MLILQRREGESLLIGENIELTVVSIDGSRVRLAVNAPRDISILRGELVKAQEVNQDAAKPAESAELLHMLEGVLPSKAASSQHYSQLAVKVPQIKKQKADK